ncbi:MAG: response regulator [Cystobacter sp.]
MSAHAASLAGRVLLVVEDEYLVAAEMVDGLERRGATVLGPVPDVRRALALLGRTKRLDGALLDIQLRDEQAYPVAEALRARGVPFIFVSGFEQELVPEAYRGVPTCPKPLELDAVAEALFSGRPGTLRCPG